MATDRLKIYNGALLICGSRSIASLTVNEEARRLLDEVWNDDGIRNCLQAGQWKFAMRTAKLTPETAITPSFGYANAYAKASDWVTTASVCSDEYFNVPLLKYSDEAGYLYSDLDEIYVRYVSDHADFGGDFSKWPANFTQYVKTYFASRIILKLSTDKTMTDAIIRRNGLLDTALKNAKNSDAQADPTKFLPQGNWTKARFSGGWNDGGSNNNLIG